MYRTISFEVSESYRLWPYFEQLCNHYKNLYNVTGKNDGWKPFQYRNLELPYIFQNKKSSSRHTAQLSIVNDVKFFLEVRDFSHE